MAFDDKNYSAWEQLLFCENALGHKDSVKYYGEMRNCQDFLKDRCLILF